MKTLGKHVCLGILAISFASVACGQGGQRVSPRQTETAMLGGKKVSIEYSRPYMKGRKIFGALVPYGEVWRTGADEATKLTTEADLMVGSIHVPAGSYSLFTIPTAKGWTLIINKQANQWGAYNYKAAEDLGRAEMTVKQGSAPEEQLTIAIANKGDGKGTLTIAWETTVASVDLMAH